MKITISLLLVSVLFAVCQTASVSSKPKSAIALPETEQQSDDDRIKRDDDEQQPEDERIKRAGGNVLGYITNKVTSGISSGLQSGISKIASASSSITSKGDGHSFGGGGGGHGHVGGGGSYGPPPPPPPHHGGDEGHGEGKLDGLWSFKRSIVQTLIQAVKAITGGVIGIGGQVTKGAGHVVEVKGRFLQNAGDSIYDFGKHVSQKALSPIISPVAHHPAVHTVAHPIAHGGGVSHGLSAAVVSHTSYEAPAGSYPSGTGYSGSHSSGGGASGYGGTLQSAPLVGEFSSYGGSGPSDEYGAPHYQVARAAKPAPAAHTKSNNNGVKAGLLVLKPINVPAYDARSNGQSNKLHHASSNNYQYFVQPPVQYSRSFNPQAYPMSYDAQLGYNFPSIQYE